MACLLLIGCSNNDKDLAFNKEAEQSLELTKLSTEGITDQQPSNTVKQFLSQNKEVSQIRAVNVGEDLFIAINVRQRDRFSLDKIEQDLREQAKENQPHLDVTLSTDQKFIVEIKKLEQKIDQKEISQKQLQEKINKLKTLSREET